jgi:iron complex transport system ATP-binding protein
MVELRNLSIGYGTKVVASGINASAEPGEVVVVAGRNGAGKSTLLQTLCGLLPRLDGQVMVDGTELHRLNALERAQKVALVTATTQLPTALNVREVIALGAWPQHASETEIDRLLERFNLTDRAHHRLDQISDGERQKTLIARALVQSTPVLVMDEPTAFLDFPSRVEWWDGIRQLAGEGKTLLVATHDLQLAYRSSQVDRYWLIHPKTKTLKTYRTFDSLEALVAAMD